MALFRAFATVGGYTALSRVLGLVREILIANFVGAGFVADAFFVAFRLPNLFRRVFAEGAFNAAFVPLFARRLEEEGEAAARRFAEETLAVFLFVLLGLTVLAMAAMPWLMRIIAPGFFDDSRARSTASASPSNSASTRPSRRLRTQPVSSVTRTTSWVAPRK